MTRFRFLLLFLFVTFISNAQENSHLATEKPTFYGDSFDVKSPLVNTDISDAFKSINGLDSLNIKFKASVKKVCKVKGCWMKVDVQGEENVMVRFKDYGFFVPANVLDKEVVVNGVAFVEEMSVSDQRHYAKDAGMSKEEISKIISPKRTYSFVANGVLILE